ncbi:MAG: fluoride efflux transporter CrcB [Vulcanimicrobiaceae bacterium]
MVRVQRQRTAVFSFAAAKRATEPVNLAATVASVGLGGAIGSILRFAVATIAAQRLGPGFPWGTLVINVTGSFVIGVVAELVQTRLVGSAPLVRSFLMIGVLGGYTTFSTFSLDMLTLVGDRAPFLAAAYAVASVLLGLLAAFAGLASMRAFSPSP